MKSLIIKILISVGSGIASFFIPIIPALFFVLGLIAVDTITGIMKAGKEDVSEISSKKAFKLIPKVILYFIFLMLCHGAALIWKVPLVSFCLIGISAIEVKSIDENFKVISGRSFIDETLEAIKKIKSYERK